MTIQLKICGLSLLESSSDTEIETNPQCMNIITNYFLELEKKGDV
jgi:hypothetical protein